MSTDGEHEVSHMDVAPVAPIHPQPMSISSTAAGSDSSNAPGQDPSPVHGTSIPVHTEECTSQSVHSPGSITLMIPRTVENLDRNDHDSIVESQHRQNSEQTPSDLVSYSLGEQDDSETRLSASRVVTTPAHDPGSPTAHDSFRATSTDPGPDERTTVLSSTRAREPPSLSLSLGPLSNFSPQSSPFTILPSDEPPPYSPTHTILPHYFSLEPIPIRSYIIRDSSGLPFINDFWLITTNHQTQSFQVQERGLSPTQSQNQLRYCIIRPTRTDRTALPAFNATGPNSYFIPAMALVAANYPSRWVWWGTEALQMVVFGRQQKNIIMEWRWKQGRSRIGGPIETRLVGCSFRVTPERKYCWKQGTGKRVRNHGRNRRRRDGSGMGSSSSSPDHGNNTRSYRGWFSRLRILFSSSTTTNDVPLESVPSEIRVQNSDGTEVISPTVPDAVQNDQASTTDQGGSENRNAEANNQATSNREQDEDEDDEEAGAYHCREECESGVTGRIVAVYKPARAANRARDRPAASRKLEIYAEVGERCETAMMLMCVRLDDLFLSIPEQKRKPFVQSPATGGQEGGTEQTGHGTEQGDSQVGNDVVVDMSNDGRQPNDPSEDVAREGESVGEAMVDQPRAKGSILRRIFIGTHRHAWKDRVKGVVAVALIVLVVVLVVKPKH